LKTKTIVAPR